MIPFNERLDKITEKELVYDILNRLKWGNTVTGPNEEVYAQQGSSLADMLINMIGMSAPLGITDLSNSKIATLTVPAGSTAGVCTVINGSNGAANIVRAISYQTGLDYTDFCTATATSGVSTITFNCDAPMLHDELIKIYYN